MTLLRYNMTTEELHSETRYLQPSTIQVHICITTSGGRPCNTVVSKRVILCAR